MLATVWFSLMFYLPIYGLPSAVAFLLWASKMGMDAGLRQRSLAAAIVASMLGICAALAIAEASAGTRIFNLSATQSAITSLCHLAFSGHLGALMALLLIRWSARSGLCASEDPAEQPLERPALAFLGALVLPWVIPAAHVAARTLS